MRTWIGRIASVSLVALGGCMGGPADVGGHNRNSVSGAGFTTVNQDLPEGEPYGCLDNPTGIDCNNYVDKNHVYMSGGPGPSGVGDGWYFFAVLTPGSQNGGFFDGARGNLSDTTVGGTVGDTGHGDLLANRTFHVTAHEVDYYGGTHTVGHFDGRYVIGLAPFDDTDNPGGVYILAICSVTATKPNDCKFDAFKINAALPPPPSGCTDPTTISGAKYYDANANGIHDASEAFIAGWEISFSGAIDPIITDASGFTVSVTPGTYTFSELLPSNTTTTQQGTTIPTWMQTGNTSSQLVFSGAPGSSGILSNFLYTITVVECSQVSGTYFGNLCLGAGGGLTLGFWSNKNGQALITCGDLDALSALHLVNAAGADFNPNCAFGLKSGASSLRTWLLNGTATNMSYMLSVQLATMKLNVLHGSVSGSSLVYAPGVPGANPAGFISIGDLIAIADATLALPGGNLAVSGSPLRAVEEAIKNALDNANNNKTFVQPSAATCPAPIF